MIASPTLAHDEAKAGVKGVVIKEISVARVPNTGVEILS